MKIIETVDDNWDVVPELEEALQAVDMIDTLMYEIRNCNRRTPLKELVETLIEEFEDAISILEDIDTDIEYRTIS
jgi:hypothetical protein